MKKIYRLLIPFMMAFLLASCGVSSTPSDSEVKNQDIESTVDLIEENKEDAKEGILLDKDMTENEKAEEPAEAPKTPSEEILPVKDNKPLFVEFIDVGQGDSVLVVAPDGKSMLIDAGDSGNFPVIQKRLQEHGVTKIDVLVATHPHADHIGSMSEVIKNFPIGEIYMPEITHTSKTFENLLYTIQGKNYGINIGEKGIKIPFGNTASMTVLSPSGTPKDLNNASIVLMLQYGKNKFLFMGDAEKEAESSLSGDLSADVIKIGHHGSSTSTTRAFIEKVSPTFAVISVGKGNSYGHPTEDVLARLHDLKIKTYRTDLSGHITFTSDGEKVTVANSAKEYVYSKQEAPVVKNEPKPTPAPAPVPAPTPKPSPEPTTAPVETPEPVVDNNQNVSKIVYITKTGEKYHLDGCRSLSRSQIEITLDKAIARGFEPCSVCKP